MKYKKSLGQNFLINKNKINEIIKSFDFTDNFVIEVGPGKGALTDDIQKYVKKLLLIEIDQAMINFLKTKPYINNKNIEILNQDVLNVDFSKFLQNEQEVIFISNLPYYIASQIIFKVINEPKIKMMGIMLQEELAKRIISEPFTKKYGRITVALQSYFEIKKKINVKRDNFFPIPNVDSMFLILKKRTEKFANEVDFEYLDFIKKAFANKRKTLLNSLKNQDFKQINFIIEYFEQNHIKLNIRAEEIKVDQFIKIWFFLKNKMI